MIQLLRFNQEKFKYAPITIQNGEHGELATLANDLV
jgi:hypothetical protein